MLMVFRFVAHIPVPGVDSRAAPHTFDQNAVLGFMNIFSGGALENMSVAALGVYPYITATIVMQLATPLVPRLQQLSQEGENGRQPDSDLHALADVPLAAFQGYAQLLLIQQLGGITTSASPAATRCRRSRPCSRWSPARCSSCGSVS
jgi:preprotein translocase subunit SecY